MSKKGLKAVSVRERIIGKIPAWMKWGPYVSERSWGTVREDYSSDGDSWTFFPHDQARKKAYRWGEDGIAGICDRYQVLVFSCAFWNEKDAILKERTFGLNSHEGNHGEDVKEYFFYLDNNLEHTYMKYLYKYPQSAFPYEALVEENKKRSANDPEFELMSTGIFDQGRYFDIFIEYAKAEPEDLVIRWTIWNRGPEEAKIHLLPHLFYRNFWMARDNPGAKPVIYLEKETDAYSCLVADDSKCDPVPQLNFPYRLGKRYFYAEGGGKALFTENETNFEAIWKTPNPSPFVKDAFHRYVVQGEQSVNPEHRGTKACVHYAGISIPPGKSHQLDMRLSDKPLERPFQDIDAIFEKRLKETDRFYEGIHPKKASDEEKMIQRQAISGMLWGKQIYLFDVNEWLKGDAYHASFPGREEIRNKHWKHLVSKRIMSMPDKWEYPWFAAWDLAFQCVTLAIADIEFAKEQLWLLLFDQFQHPNGQIPAYEWEYSDLNPPVQAWAAWRIYKMDEKRTGKKDLSFLKKCFHKLILNFVWWVNRVDKYGNNVFEGGFLGLDNITVIDRSSAIPGGGSLEQSDGTGWMGMFCLKLMRIALELALEDPDYESMAVKFFEHYVYIATALSYSPNRDIQIWNEQEGFFYDVLNLPNNKHQQIFVRSLVGIIPLYAIDFISEEELEKYDEFRMSFKWFLENRKDLVDFCVTPIEQKGYMLALGQISQVKRVLERVWSPEEFRSPFGLRSLSKFHEKNPFHLYDRSVFYEPAESRVRLKGGNSNWRGPIWFPTTFLLIESLKKLHAIMGDDFKIEVKGEAPATLKQMAQHFAHGLINIYKKDAQGKRPVFGEYTLFQEDPHWNSCFLFHEYFHGDLGWGLGASHQTGWSGLIANLIDEFIE